MLNGINALIEAFSLIFTAIFTAPLYGDLTWGMFLIGCTVIGIMISFFIARMK